MQSRYQIKDEINQGGVGVVLKALDTRLQRHVAIKRFLPAARESGIESDLLREATTLSALQHPNVVSIFDVFNDEDHGVSVVMEYLNGQDLEQAVAQAALTLEDFYTVAQQTLDALSTAHRLGLLHRDIKPSNIQVTWLANGKFVSKFVDFGLARFFKAPKKQTVRADGTVMGSVFFMSPEQIERLPLDHRSDIYSLGCVFYFALSMHRPFEGKSVQDVLHAHLNGTCTPLGEFRPNLPPGLLNWIAWLMARRPEDRPQDAEIALTALRNVMGLASTPVPEVATSSQPALPRVTTVSAAPVPEFRPAEPPVPTATVVPLPRPRFSKWAVAAAAMAVLAAGGAYLIRPKDDTARPPDTQIPIVQTPGPGSGSVGRAAAIPMQGLALWLDAGRGVSLADGTQSASAWASAGTAGAASKFLPLQQGMQASWPMVQQCQFGTSMLPVLHFQAGGLVWSGTPPALADSQGITCLILCNPQRDQDAARSLISARGADGSVQWAAGWQRGLTTCTDAEAGRTLDYLRRADGYILLSLVFDRKKGNCQRRIINAAGDKVVDEVPLAPSAGPAQSIHIGCLPGADADPAIPFFGEIAEVLLYAAELPDSERRQAEDFLRLKYFGSAHATTLADESR